MTVTEAKKLKDALVEMGVYKNTALALAAMWRGDISLPGSGITLKNSVAETYISDGSVIIVAKNGDYSSANTYVVEQNDAGISYVLAEKLPEIRPAAPQPPNQGSGRHHTPSPIPTPTSAETIMGVIALRHAVEHGTGRPTGLDDALSVALKLNNLGYLIVKVPA